MTLHATPMLLALTGAAVASGGPGATHTEFGAVTSILTSFEFATGLATADFDGDGEVDLAVGTRVPSTVRVYRNPGSPGSPWTEIEVTADLMDLFDVAAADLDGDGDLDLLSASEDDDKIAWYENVDGDGANWAARTITTSALGVRYLFPADIDGDGDVDFAAAHPGEGVIAWYENEAGDASLWTLRVVSTYFARPSKLAVADLDADGDMDLVTTDILSGQVSWFENTDGYGTAWSLRQITAAIIWPRAVDAGDLDGDGDLDVASASRNDDMIAWYENDGASPPAFTMHVLTSNPGWEDVHGQCDPCASECGFSDGAIDVDMADLDLDGDLDLVATAAHADRIFWLENAAGDGSQWTTHNLANPGNPRETALADVDGDGDTDVLYVNKSIAGSGPLVTPGKGASWVENILLPGPPPVFAGICSDGVDNDGDCRIDYPADNGCLSEEDSMENAQCDDGLDNDLDGGIDWNGNPPDPQCVGLPWRNHEGPSCGIGGELALLLLGLMWLRRRRRSPAA